MLTQPNKENIGKWVQALRSGRFVQGRGKLCKIETLVDGREEKYFCCLGVACELALADGVDMTKVISEHTVFYGGSPGTLPLQVQRWLGIMEQNPNVKSSPNGVDFPVKYGLVHLNDEHHLGFDKIADAIEAEYLGDDDDQT